MLRQLLQLCPGTAPRLLRGSAIVLVLGGFLAGGRASAGPTNVSGRISTDTTWTVAGSPYIVTGNIQIYGSTTSVVTLTIDPGVEVRFNANTWLYVGWGSNLGTLRSLGTAVSPVLFTSNQTTKTPGFYNGIAFEPGSGTTGLLQHTTVEYGGQGSGQIYVNQSTPQLTNATVRQSGANAINVVAGGLSLSTVTVANTVGTYAVTMPATTPVTTAGTHSFDKPIELRAMAIQVDTTWRNLGAPYVLSGTTQVYKNTTTASTLTVEAGVEVRMAANIWLYSGWGGNLGTLRSLGTAGSPVLFTSNQTTKTPGFWNGIAFEPGSGTTGLLQHTTVEYGGQGSGQIYINQSTPQLTNTTVRQSGGNAINVVAGGLSLSTVTVANTVGTYAVTMPAITAVTTVGTHSFDKPIELRAMAIQVDSTWRKLGAPYVLSGTTQVYKNTTTFSTLTVEAGVEVRMAAGAWLYSGWGGNRGTLRSLGTAASPVLFTSNQTTKTPGFWGGISFEAGSLATGLLQYTTLEYGGASYGQLYVDGSTPRVENSTVRQSGAYGVQVQSGTPTLVNTTITASGMTPATSLNQGIYVNTGGLGLENVTVSATTGNYSITMPANTAVTTAGTHSFDKPIELRAGAIQVDTTWRRLGAPYVLSGTTQVYKNTTTSCTLTVEAGVEVRMAANTWLYSGWGGNRGTLRSLGTAASPVLFTSNQTTKTPGFWAGISFESGSLATGLLQFTTVEYGGTTNYGMIYVDGSTPSLVGATLRHSLGVGLQAVGAAAPVIRATSFTNIGAAAVSNTGSQTVDARANWWSHASGPSGTGPGSGHAIQGKALFSPWLEAAPAPALYAADAQVTKLFFNVTNDATTLLATLSASATWSLTVHNPSGAVVMTYGGTGSAVSQAWNGEQSGTSDKVPPGLYTLRLSAAGMASLVARVRTTNNPLPVAVITAPAPNAVFTGGTLVSIVGTAADPNNFVSYRVEQGVGATPTSWAAITPYPYDLPTQVHESILATWTPPVGPAGLYTVRLTVRDADSPPAVASQPLRVMGIYNPQHSGLYFSPNGDGVSDTFTVTATLTLPANWTLTFKDAGLNVVRTFTGTGATSVNQAWDGKDGAGVPLPEAAYTYTLTAVEPGSGVAATPFTGTVTIDRTPPTAIITAPGAGATVFDTITVTGTASDPNNFQRYQLQYGAGAAPTSWTSLIISGAQVTAGTLYTWITNSFIDEVLVPGGNGTYTLRLTVLDLAGNSAVALRTVALDNMLVSGVTRNPTIFRPASGESTTINFNINQSANVIVRILLETAPLKVYPDQTPETGVLRTLNLGLLAAGARSAVWDGRNDSGTIVPEEAYTYVIQAQAPSGRFDKFNRHVVLTAPPPSLPFAGGYVIPASATVINPAKNQFFSYSFSPTGNPGRGSLRIMFLRNSTWTTLARQESSLLLPGSNTVFWDGRDDSGNILTDYTSINYYLIGRVNPFAEHFLGLRTNHVIVLGNKPRLPGVSVRSDPYQVNMSYGQVTRLGFELEDAARITLSVQDATGSLSRTLIDNELRDPGEHEVVWDGLLGNGVLSPTPGNYTFTVMATDPTSGATTIRRGNIIVFK